MALETATYIDGLDSANPAGSDAISTADDHLRLIKSTIKATFPNITGPVTKTQAEINGLAPLASPTFTGTPAAPTAAAGTNTTQVATTAFVTTATNSKADKTTTITAGTGLTGGGDLSANRTIGISAGGISATELASDAVTTAKILDAAVTASKLAAGVAVSNIGYTPVNSSAFTGANQSLGTDGYQKLPGGLILQWGYTGPGSATTFPIPFPNAALQAFPVVQNTSGSSYAPSHSNVVNLTTTGFGRTSQSFAIRWFAIGY